MVHERARLELHRRLEEVIGAEAADTLIEQLSPGPWGDIAIKLDLAQLEERVALRLDRSADQIAAVDASVLALSQHIDTRFDVHADLVWESLLGAEVNFETALVAHTTTIAWALAGTVVALAGLALAYARFAG